MGGFSSIWQPIEELDQASTVLHEEYTKLNEAKIKAEAAKKAYKAKQSELESTALINKFLIGCDPEFVGVYGGVCIPMSRYFTERGTIGLDHGGSVGEFRPKPAKYAWTLIHRLKESVEVVKKKGIQGKVRAGAMVSVDRGNRSYVTLGGHIHIDLDPYDGVLGGGEWHGKSVPYTDYVGNTRTKYAGYTADWDITSPRATNPYGAARVNVILSSVSAVSKKISKDHLLRVAALDEFTKLLEHLDILPKKECEARRTTSEYGKYGDVRIQNSSETLDSNDFAGFEDYRAAVATQKAKHRMEYRTMASWLYDPIVAFLCLTGAKVAAAYPDIALDNLKGKTAFSTIPTWLERYASKDMDCARLAERYLVKGHKAMVIDPGTDIRERWDTTK